MFSHHRAALLLLVAPLFALGCSGEAKNPNAPATVTGEVTYKGEKLGGGTITFSNEKGEYPAPIRADGTYTATDLPTGEMSVSFETESVKNSHKGQAYGGNPEMMKSMSSMSKDQKSEASYVKIPDKYSNPKRSEKTCTLKAGRNIQNFDLD